MEKNQKEYYLNEQMQAIQKELGERDDLKSEMAELEERINKKKMSAEATEKVRKEFKKLKMMRIYIIYMVQSYPDYKYLIKQMRSIKKH